MNPDGGCSSHHMTVQGHQGCDACCTGATPGVRETVQEMDFQRGIWSAALYGDLSQVQRFIEKGTDPNLADNFGYTALHYSSRHGHFPVCSFLLNSGADSNAQTHGGSTALHRAAYCGHLKVVELLLKNGADPAKTDSDGRTVLHKSSPLQNTLCVHGETRQWTEPPVAPGSVCRDVMSLCPAREPHYIHRMLS